MFQQPWLAGKWCMFKANPSWKPMLKSPFRVIPGVVSQNYPTLNPKIQTSSKCMVILSVLIMHAFFGVIPWPLASPGDRRTRRSRPPTNQLLSAEVNVKCAPTIATKPMCLDWFLHGWKLMENPSCSGCKGAGCFLMVWWPIYQSIFGPRSR